MTTRYTYILEVLFAFKLMTIENQNPETRVLSLDGRLTKSQTQSQKWPESDIQIQTPQGSQIQDMNPTQIQYPDPTWTTHQLPIE